MDSNVPFTKRFKLTKLSLGMFILIVFLAFWKYESPKEIDSLTLSNQMIHGTFSDDINLVSFNYDCEECYLYLPNLQFNEKLNFEVLDSNTVYFETEDGNNFLCFFEASGVKLVNISNKNMVVPLPRKDHRIVTYSN